MNSCPHCGRSPLSPGAPACPHCGALLSAGSSSARAVEGTRLESVADLRRWLDPGVVGDAPPPGPVVPTGRQATEDIRRWANSPSGGAAPGPPPNTQRRAAPASAPPRPSAPAPPVTAPPAADADDALPFRPTARPPLLALCIVDDGRQGGEWLRIRGDRAIIGRAEGDILVPHDPGISSRHAELVRVNADDRVRWVLRDLQSRNGTFVLIKDAPLRHLHEFVVGTRRFRFEAAESGAPPDPAAPVRNTTRGWQAVTPADTARLVPSIVELTNAGDGARTQLAAAEYWIGSDRTCGIIVSGDPFVSRRHAKLVRTAKGTWQIENAGSRNGTWLRIAEVPIESSVEFQAGEQRFLAKVC
jgi:pSer/pThr/pTyr-binding forkhead associated (FHA) protein